MIGIYCIHSFIDDKRYVGQTTNLERRVFDHKRKLRLGKHHNEYLQRAWNKLGEGNFNFYVLCECLDSELDFLESKFIEQFQSNKSQLGYNLESGGNRLKMLSEETKRKIAAWNIGRKHSDETRRKLSEINKGRKPAPITDEQRLAISKRMTGNRIRLGKTGYKQSEEHKAKRSLSMLGNHNAKGAKRTEEEKRHLSEIMKARKGIKYQHTPEFLYKQANKPSPTPKYRSGERHLVKVYKKHKVQKSPENENF